MIKSTTNPLAVCKENINHLRQNKPTYVAKDMEELFGVPRHATYKILLARGVFKWLSVRRDLIRLKDAMKKQITDTIEFLSCCKGHMDLQHRTWYLRGYLAAKNEDRQVIKTLCHSSRWQAPDHDPFAQRWLKSQEDDVC